MGGFLSGMMIKLIDTNATDKAESFRIEEICKDYVLALHMIA